MWLFGKRAKLLRRLDALSIYNDKGISWSKHAPAQVEAERARRMASIEQLVSDIGRDLLPSQFLADLETGQVALDPTGRYVRDIRAHFGGRGAL